MQLSVSRQVTCLCRFLVEIEIILPAQMTVQESHDIALMLQHKVEALPDVERGELILQAPPCDMVAGAALYTKPCAEGCAAKNCWIFFCSPCACGLPETRRA